MTTKSDNPERATETMAPDGRTYLHTRHGVVWASANALRVMLFHQAPVDGRKRDQWTEACEHTDTNQRLVLQLQAQLLDLVLAHALHNTVPIGDQLARLIRSMAGAVAILPRCAHCELLDRRDDAAVAAALAAPPPEGER